LSPTIHQSGETGRFRRLLAAGCAALVFALGLFAVSPVLHEQLHHNDHSSVDDGCAIVLFANGLALSLAVNALPPPPAEWCAQPVSGSTEFVFAAPPYLLQPERGPPIG
jgi:hypothetical protein